MKSIKAATLLLSVFVLGLVSYIVINKLQDDISIEVGTLYPDDFKQVSPFELKTGKNQAYTEESFKDKWTLLFFGFISCPDVCPTSLVTLQQIKQKIQGTIPEDKIEYVFISVDPKRDTPEKLDEYVTYFDPAFTGVTGEESQLKKLTRSLAAFFSIPEHVEGENYLVEHSASIYLIGENAQPKVLFSYPHTADKMANDILALYKS